MIARGFYSIPTSVFADAGEDTKTPGDFGCIVLATHAQKFYLHSHIKPNEALEEAGGTLLADDWAGLKAALLTPAKNKIFHKLVKREVTVEGEKRTITIMVPRSAGKAGDVVEADWLPPHSFLGDPEPEPVP